MKFVIQRVNRAEVTVDGRSVGRIGKGFLVLVGICEEDTEETADKMVRKMCGLRIFMDDQDKTNLALKDVDGSLLLVSQFTLYADCRKGNRPSFVKAGDPVKAQQLFDYIVKEAGKYVDQVETGVFGAYMKIALENDGPFTVVLDSEEIVAKHPKV